MLTLRELCREAILIQSTFRDALSGFRRRNGGCGVLTKAAHKVQIVEIGT